MSRLTAYLRRRAEPIIWFHSIELPDGTVTPGSRSLPALRAKADLFFRADLVRNRSFLDIGAWDGFFSFEAEKRGAARVMATDHFCWSGDGWGTKSGFDFAHRALGSKVASIDVDVFNLSPKKLGLFDVVLFAGVLYHLTDPWGGLKRAADMSRDLLIVETVTTLNDIPEPVMRYYLGDEMGNDPTNYWAPNAFCVEQMLREMGFSKFERTHPPKAGAHERLIVHAWR